MRNEHFTRGMMSSCVHNSYAIGRAPQNGSRAQNVTHIKDQLRETFRGGHHYITMLRERRNNLAGKRQTLTIIGNNQFSDLYDLRVSCRIPVIWIYTHVKFEQTIARFAEKEL